MTTNEILNGALERDMRRVMDELKLLLPTEAVVELGVKVTSNDNGYIFAQAKLESLELVQIFGAHSWDQVLSEAQRHILAEAGLEAKRQRIAGEIQKLQATLAALGEPAAQRTAELCPATVAEKAEVIL